VNPAAERRRNRRRRIMKIKANVKAGGVVLGD